MSDRALAERLVRLAGGIALELRGGAVEVKGDATDVVTEADRRAEAAQLELLQAERPGDGVLGEEGASVAGGARRWLLDPVDGTLNYARGLPAWCSAVVLMDGAGALAVRGVRPGRRRAVQRRARGGGDARRRAAARRPAAGAGGGGRGHVRRRPPARARGHRRHRGAAARLGALRAVGCGTLELAWIAAGRLHGWVQAGTEPWDWHPGALLVAEAGGVARVTGTWHVAAAGPALADELDAAVT